ncbi:MAG TPA: NAD-binding protein, partial [Candidatus Tectomicrobia bacterium]|nr:NAD-binding protein [Candidatus Tectomicrobia bacterium]
GDFTPRFSIALSRKDLSLALTMAEALGVPMLATAVVRQVYEAAAAQGLDDLDMAGVTRLYEQWAGVQVRARRQTEAGRDSSVAGASGSDRDRR